MPVHALQRLMLAWFDDPEPLLFDSAMYSTCGGRANQEDALGSRELPPNGAVWVVADGVGGQAAGEVAAQLAVDTVLQRACAAMAGDDSQLETLLRHVHDTLRAAQQKTRAHADMATTGVVLLSDGRRALWGHVGDSRLYHVRDGHILHRTEDHSLLNLLLGRGALDVEDVEHFAQRHVILQALGQDKPPQFTVSQPIRLQAGDGFLLCTDGWWELLSDEELLHCRHPGSSARDWLAAMQRLLESRLTADSDNATVQVINVRRQSLEKE